MAKQLIGFSSLCIQGKLGDWGISLVSTLEKMRPVSIQM